jgi:hypothetical protein
MNPHVIRPESPKWDRERIWEVLSVLGAAGRVELKVTVPETDQSSAVEALQMDVLDAELRQVAFFDTPDLALNRGGLTIRARRIRTGGDVTVKLRPLVPAILPGKLRRSPDFKIEVDVTPELLVCSGSLKSSVDNADVKRVLQGQRPIRKLLQPEQRALYREHAPAGLDLDSLMAFGPITVAKLKVSPKGLGGRNLAAELWFFPDASRLLELSTKCRSADAYQVAAETRTFLTHRGVNLAGLQETKTRRALEYFAHLCAPNGSFKRPRLRKRDR